MHRIDVVGDVHGHLRALEALGRRLGYDVNRGWAHPDGRVLVFLGDLVDRGPESLAVGRLVRDLERSRRAVCLMGNHEYNLLEAVYLGEKAREKATYDDVVARRAEWEPVLDYFTTLPLAIELPDLRIVHAGWHSESVRTLHPLLRPDARETGEHDTWCWVRNHVVLASPFRGRKLREGLPAWGRDGSHATMVEVILKGFERRAPKRVIDHAGRVWSNERVCWWKDPAPEIDTELPTVFGHYWSMPPASEDSRPWPPAAPGTDAIREWQVACAGQVHDYGERALRRGDRNVCVDFGGMLHATGRGCVGAYRYPEHQVWWATEPLLG